MVRFESAETIDAPTEAVWAVLANARAWPDWDSGVTAVEGTVRLAEKVTVRSAVAPGRAFPVKVTKYVEPSIMEFTGGMPLGMFRGVRTYRLVNEGTDRTRFTMVEEYTGPMAPLITRSIPDLTPSFAQFALGLKHRVERGA